MTTEFQHRHKDEGFNIEKDWLTNANGYHFYKIEFETLGKDNGYFNSLNSAILYAKELIEEENNL